MTAAQNRTRIPVALGRTVWGNYVRDHMFTAWRHLLECCFAWLTSCQCGRFLPCVFMLTFLRVHAGCNGSSCVCTSAARQTLQLHLKQDVGTSPPVPHPTAFSGRPGRPGSHLPRWKPFLDQEARKPGWITGSTLPGLGLVNIHELVAWTSGAIQAAHVHGCAHSLVWTVIQASPVSHQLVRNVTHKWTLSVCSGHMFRSLKVLKGPGRSWKALKGPYLHIWNSSLQSASTF